MAMPTQLEVERLLNLVRGFGWEMKSQKIEGGKLVIELQKPVEEKPVPIPT